MGTNEPPAGRSGDEGNGTAGDPYAGYTPYPSGPSYSGYREGVDGEPVPDAAWQGPGPTAQYPGPTAQYPGPTAQYPGPTAQYPGLEAQYPGPTAQNPYPAAGNPGTPQDPYAQYGSPYPPPPYGGPPVPGAYPPGPYPYAPPRPTNGMAVASMVLGILWLYWVGSILALIFGYIARQQIRERGEGGDGMAVAGIVLGWIGVGVVAVFLLIFLFAGLSTDFR